MLLKMLVDTVVPRHKHATVSFLKITWKKEGPPLVASLSSLDKTLQK